jgi:hypothetical protein
MEELVFLIRQIKEATGVQLFHEHRGFWARVAPQFEAPIYFSLGYELVAMPGWLFESCFLQKGAPHFDSIEIIGNRSIPEHEAFATRTFEDFVTVVDHLKSLKESTEVLYRTDNGFVYTAMFKFKGFDTGIEILFRHPDKNIFDPKQVFG